MKERGKVIKVEKTFITVRFQRKTECDKCKMCAFSEGMSYFDLKMENAVNAIEGDTVEVSLQGGAVLVSGIIVYFIPLLFTAIGLLIGYFSSGETLSAILGVVFLAIGFLIVCVTEKILKKNGKLKTPIVTGIIE